MDNGGVGRFADGRCPVSTRKGGGGGPLEPEGSSNPNVRISVGGGEEHRLYQEPRTKYRVPFTQEAPLPLPDKGGQPSLPPYLFVSVSSHKRADGNRESSTSSWLMMLHVALSAYGEYVQVHGYKYTCVCVCIYWLVPPSYPPTLFVDPLRIRRGNDLDAIPMFLFCGLLDGIVLEFIIFFVSSASSSFVLKF